MTPLVCWTFLRWHSSPGNFTHSAFYLSTQGKTSIITDCFANFSTFSLYSFTGISPKKICTLYPILASASRWTQNAPVCVSLTRHPLGCNILAHPWVGLLHETIIFLSLGVGPSSLSSVVIFSKDSICVCQMKDCITHFTWAFNPTDKYNKIHLKNWLIVRCSGCYRIQNAIKIAPHFSACNFRSGERKL